MSDTIVKRSASSADLVPNQDQARSRKDTPDQLFLYTNMDTCIVLHLPKLLDKAPDSWFAKLVHDPERGTQGNSQEEPYRVALPTWFVQDVADWTQPMSTQRVHSSRPDEAMREMLAAIGWTATDRDLPVAFIEKTPSVAPGVGVSQMLLCLLSDYLPSRLTKKLGSVQAQCKQKRYIFYCPSVGGKPADYGTTAEYKLDEEELIILFNAVQLAPTGTRATHSFCFQVDHGCCTAHFYVGCNNDCYTHCGIALDVHVVSD